MQGGGGGDAGRAPPSPRSNDSIASKICLLRQRVLGSEENQQHQAFQQQQNQQHQAFQQQQNPSSMGFSLGEQAQERPFSQQHLQQKQESSQPIDRGDFSLAPGFGPAQLFMNQNQPILQPNGGPPVQAQGAGAGAGVSQESLMGALSAIQQNISHLQSMLSYMNHGQQVPNALVQQQAAAAISQIARVAANMFPQSAPQPPPSHLPSPGPPRPPQQHLGQLMPPLITPSNFYQDCGPPGGGGSDPVMESNGSFSSAIRGMDGGGAQSDTLAAQIGTGGRPHPPPPTSGLLPARSISPAQGGGVNAPSHLGNNMGPGGPRGGNHGSAAVPRESAKGGDLGRQHLSSRSAALDEHDEPTGGGGGGEGEGHRDEDEDGELEVLAPGSYDLVDMDAVEILAEHTHFCEICGKGFKRDANLRMHMRGHGDEYKTAAALARPDRGAGADSAAVRQRRFSCPYVGCKRNKKHRKFQPLKTMLCVKNHYRRSHCPKIHTCSKCKAKKFSVVADLKTHEKHCGCDKWQCSCGTSFSRKDKLFGHIGLFTGHTPAMPFADADGSGDLNVSDLGGGGGDPTSLSGDVVGDAGYGTMASGLGGGNGMGLGTGGRQGQGLGSRGGGGLVVSKDGGLGPETSGSSDSFPSPGNLLPSYMSGNIFNTNYVQSGSGS